MKVIAEIGFYSNVGKGPFIHIVTSVSLNFVVNTVVIQYSVYYEI